MRSAGGVRRGAASRGLGAARGAARESARRALGAKGVHAAVAWTMISTPAEPGPLPPVSRAWNFVKSNPAEADAGQWSYVIFAWDNQLAALLAGLNSSFTGAHN